MLRITKTSYTMILLFLVAGVIQGCSDLGKTYSEINPQDAELQVKKHNGYYDLKSISSGKSKLVLRSEGMPYPVKFSYCSGSCEKHEDLGAVEDLGRGILLPWIADLNRKTSPKEYLVLEVPPGQHISVDGLGEGASNHHVFYASKTCGPLNSSFMPLENHNYLVRFLWENDSCRLDVSDATDPDNLKPLPASEQPSSNQTSN